MFVPISSPSWWERHFSAELAVLEKWRHPPEAVLITTTAPAELEEGCCTIRATPGLLRSWQVLGAGAMHCTTWSLRPRTSLASVRSTVVPQGSMCHRATRHPDR